MFAILFSLDMESIDALAKAVNEFSGGLVLVSHDMRLISQVAEEIWICDNKTVKKYHGDIQNFKMDMRNQMGIEGDQKGKLRGDASVRKGIDGDYTEKKKKEIINEEKKVETKKQSMSPTSSVPLKASSKSNDGAWDNDDEAYKKSDLNPKSSLSTLSSLKSSLPNGSSTSAPAGKYIPPHLRNKQ